MEQNLNWHRGYDRRPTEEEEDLPPDKRPWTEYDMMGNKQDRPPYKGLPCGTFCCWGSTCCVCECQWCCGEDNDQCCDVICLGRCERMPVCICCGPQCDDTDCCDCDCCRCCSQPGRSAKVGWQECCSMDCCEKCCAPRYAGCQFICLHITCIGCPAGCENCLCCKEEQLRMDGDCVPIRCNQPASMDNTPGPAVSV
eukprot:m.24112 g.24112  ORF g.24112 m.24112 type:complete len:197 (+) comp7577_c1_seq1:192-782(+)